MQRRETAARNERQKESNAAPYGRLARCRLLRVTTPVEKNAAEQHEHREQVCRLPEEQERDIRKPRARAPHQIDYGLAVARHAESGVVRVIAREREKQDHGEPAGEPQGRLPETPDPRDYERSSDARGLRSAQSLHKK